MNTVRTTSSMLKSRLGEADTMDMDSVPGTTIMQYKLTWKCGCRAEGQGTDYICKPCASHLRTFQLAV